MVVAQEHGVVAEHEHQVEGPHHGVELHEGDDAHVARHGLGHDDVAAAAEELFLAPVDGVAAGSLSQQRQGRPPRGALREAAFFAEAIGISIQESKVRHRISLHKSSSAIAGIGFMVHDARQSIFA